MAGKLKGRAETEADYIMDIVRFGVGMSQSKQGRGGLCQHAPQRKRVSEESIAELNATADRTMKYIKEQI
jgi:hypothetical protein